MTQTDNELWKANQCADFLQYSLRHFVDTISKKPGFPQRMPASTRKNMLWRKDDVINWATGARR